MKNKPIRGFKAFIGETIKRIDATAINVVHIEFESGKLVSIDAEEQHYGIPIITADNNWKDGK